MENFGSFGISTAIILASSLIIGATAATVIMNGSETYSEENLENFAEEAVDEISTYIQIKDMMGKYETHNGEQKIQKIAMLVSPLFSVNVNVSTLTIKINNGEQIRICHYAGNSEFIGTHPLFEHDLWSEMINCSFSFIVINDNDGSLVDYDILNENTDMAYIIIKLPEELNLKKGDTLTVTLFPSTGITRIKTVVAPLPLKSIVTLD